jgi:hypothetical protein
MSNDNTIRVQLDLPAARIEDLEKLQATCGLATRKDLFENALTLFEWCVQQIEKGRVIAGVDEKGDVYSEVVMPALENAKKNAAKARSAT